MTIDERVIDFFQEGNLCKEDFFDFIEDKVLVVSNNTDMFWFGCHPIVENNMLVDIRLVVPEIDNEKDMLINIHEFTHAIELYNEIGTIYIERREERENNAKEMELIYLKSK